MSFIVVRYVCISILGVFLINKKEPVITTLYLEETSLIIQRRIYALAQPPITLVNLD